MAVAKAGSSKINNNALNIGGPSNKIQKQRKSKPAKVRDVDLLSPLMITFADARALPQQTADSPARPPAPTQQVFISVPQNVQSDDSQHLKHAALAALMGTVQHNAAASSDSDLSAEETAALDAELGVDRSGSSNSMMI